MSAVGWRSQWARVVKERNASRANALKLSAEIERLKFLRIHECQHCGVMMDSPAPKHEPQCPIGEAYRMRKALQNLTLLLSDLRCRGAMTLATIEDWDRMEEYHNEGCSAAPLVPRNVSTQVPPHIYRTSIPQHVDADSSSCPEGE